MKSLVNEIDAKQAINILRKGDIVAVPTETVYGLAADATNDLAVAKIFAVKARPNFNPLIVHVKNQRQAEEIGVFSRGAKTLAKKYWPGALTIIVPKRDKNFALLATAGLETIAIRVPAHKIMRKILKSGLMLAAPSANISGKLSSTEAHHVAASFPGIDIVNGGKCELGLESTVITFDAKDKPVILRKGSITLPEAAIGGVETIVSPGQLLKHYAPQSPIRINAQKPEDDEIWIGFGNMKCDFNLSPQRDLQEAAANLFSILHQADELNKKIAVTPIPANGIGAAINDRLEKAAT